jgi:hypothetical protein
MYFPRRRVVHQILHPVLRHSLHCTPLARSSEEEGAECNIEDLESGAEGFVYVRRNVAQRHGFIHCEFDINARKRHIVESSWRFEGLVRIHCKTMCLWFSYINASSMIFGGEELVFMRIDTFSFFHVRNVCVS